VDDGNNLSQAHVRTDTNNPQLLGIVTGGGIGARAACRGWRSNAIVDDSIADNGIVHGRGQPRALGTNVSPEITAAMG